MNPDTALWCDCGYDFKRGFVDSSLTLHPTEEGEVQLKNKVRIAAAVLFLNAAIWSIFVLVFSNKDWDRASGFQSDFTKFALLSCITFSILGVLSLNEKVTVIASGIASAIGILDLGWFVIEFLSLALRWPAIFTFILWLKIILTGSLIKGFTSAYDLRSRQTSTKFDSTHRGPLDLS